MDESFCSFEQNTPLSPHEVPRAIETLRSNKNTGRYHRVHPPLAGV